MVFDHIIRNIERFITLTPSETDDFCSILEIKQFKKKERLSEPGDICNTEAFVNKGCFRTYFRDLENNEHTIYFAMEGWWVSDLYSRTFQLPSQYTVEALENSEVFTIKDDKLEAFMLRVPKMEHFYRILFQNALAVTQRRVLERHQFTADERYKLFREKYPEIDRRVPQKHIASWLGLTPEFFNTVRTRVLKNT